MKSTYDDDIKNHRHIYGFHIHFSLQVRLNRKYMYRVLFDDQYFRPVALFLI